ncbi:MAG: alpha/beta hydrolase, partial [Chloroflexota bacterium]|nr:alpha/beta hydrolase [Chloroflexota bacterium]
AIAPTLRGHGDANHPATGDDFDHFAADVYSFLDALGLASAVIVGYSLGSDIAQRFAMDHPERTSGLVLVGTVTTWRGNAAVRELWDIAIAKMTDPIDADFVREFQATPGMSPAFHDIVVHESLKVPARVWQAGFQSVMTSDFSAELGKIQAPTLIVWGDADPICPRREQEALMTAITRARLVVYAGAEHNIQWERTERLAADVVEFTQSLAS